MKHSSNKNSTFCAYLWKKNVLSQIIASLTLPRHAVKSFYLGYIHLVIVCSLLTKIFVFSIQTSFNLFLFRVQTSKTFLVFFKTERNILAKLVKKDKPGFRSMAWKIRNSQKDDVTVGLCCKSTFATEIAPQKEITKV